MTKSGYDQALATGKVRLFYPLKADQTVSFPTFLNNWGSYNCRYFEQYCIGVPYGFEDGQPKRTNLSAAYAFGVYRTAWKQMPRYTDIAEVFAIGDRCTEDIGAEGPDALTGLGRLDVGCMASEVYKANSINHGTTVLLFNEKIWGEPSVTWGKLSLKRMFKQLGFKGANYRDENAYVIGHDRSVHNGRAHHSWDSYHGLRTSPQVGRHASALLSRPDRPDDMYSNGDMSTRYTFLNAAETAQADYQSMYKTTPENSLVSFTLNPIYLHGPEAIDRFTSFGGEEMAIAPESIKDHGWIVSGASKDRITSGYPDTEEIKGYLEEGYRRALATGKVRVFYYRREGTYFSAYCRALHYTWPRSATGEEYCRGYPYWVNNTGGEPFFPNNWKGQGCRGFEQYCIGTPYRYQVGWRQIGFSSEDAATYAFGVYLTTWEKMPVNTHISAIFAMGDRCVYRYGKDEQDPIWGLGVLDIGCMAGEAYKVNLNPLVATLSVVAKAIIEPPKATVSLAAGKDVQTYWDTTNRPETLAEDFARLGVAAVASRKDNAYVVAHAGHDPSWQQRFLWQRTAPSLCHYNNCNIVQWVGPDRVNSRFNYLLDLHIGQMGKNIRYTESLLSAMGLADSYTFLDAGRPA